MKPTTQQEYIELDWEAPFSPLYGKPLIIPENTILWRGYDKSYNPVSDRYAYYGSIMTATEYAKKQNRTLGCFVTSKPLRIIDLRFLKTLISRLVYTNDYEKHVNILAPLVLSFGTCSLRNQINLMHLRYRNVLESGRKNTDFTLFNEDVKALESYYNPKSIIEQPGFRIGETENDGYTMTFLQELFSGVIDGFISPRLFTPFHVEKDHELTAELIVFNPKKSGIIESPVKLSGSHIIKIAELNNKYANHIFIENKASPEIRMNFYMVGGEHGNTFQASSEKFNELIEKKDKDALEIYKKARKDGKLWRTKMLDIYSGEPPAPTVPVSLFRRMSEIGA